LKSESKGRFPGDSRIWRSGPSSNARTISQWNPKTVRHSEDKGYRRAINALCQSDQLCSLFGIGFAEGAFSSGKMPKNNSKIRETEDLGLRIHRRAKQQSPQSCHKDDMAELKKFAQSFASINLQSHGLFNFRV
jgi:hypothetical protein